MPKKIICPHCDEEIDYLDYEAEITQDAVETGTANVDGHEIEYNNTEVYDSTMNLERLLCPECQHEFSYEELKELNKNEKKEKEKEIKKVEIVNEQGVVISKTNHYIRMYKCHKCGEKNAINILNSGKKETNCAKCGTTFTEKTKIINY